MNLLDIISLAKAGYKKSDIDELLKIPIDEPESSQDSTEEKPVPEGGPAESPEEDHEEKPDFELLYTNLKKELESVKEQLSEAQRSNIKTNNDSGVSDNTEAINDLFRSFM